MHSVTGPTGLTAPQQVYSMWGLVMFGIRLTMASVLVVRMPDFNPILRKIALALNLLHVILEMQEVDLGAWQLLLDFSLIIALGTLLIQLRPFVS